MASPTPANEPASVAEERSRRRSLWQSIKQEGTISIEPRLLRSLRIYGGAQGIWVDKLVTAAVAPTAGAVCVSILHTGRHYPDDLSDDGLIYHYPETERQPGRDAAEVEATKEAARLRLPIFVILPSPTGRTNRQVRLGWVVEWDDEKKQFLILFGESEPELQPVPTPSEPFNLAEMERRGFTRVAVRPGQQRFRFEVLKQYGAKCAVCEVAEPELIVAAHICGKADRGSDDWRNGLPLCATHHSAYDSHMFTIDPQTLRLVFDARIRPEAIGIQVARLTTRHQVPHADALNWRYDKFCRLMLTPPTPTDGG